MTTLSRHESEETTEHPKYMETWTRVAANEYGRLFQKCGRNEDGSRRIEGTNAWHWIKRNQVPKGKTVSYNREVADIIQKKQIRTVCDSQ